MCLNDFRYSARALRKNPSFAILAILTIALGIGANTSIFTAVKGVLLNAFSFPEADRLVVVTGVSKSLSDVGVSYPEDTSRWKNWVRSSASEWKIVCDSRERSPMRSSEEPHPSLQRRRDGTLWSTDPLAKPTTYPTSVKGVLVVEGRVLLVKNSRDEWELPGGHPEEGEEHAQTLAREFMEELSIKISMSAPLDSYLFEVIP